MDDLPQLINVLKGEMSLVGQPDPLPGKTRYYRMGASQRMAGRNHHDRTDPATR
jgi:lipopolysaccharide/colanic/teichoic acid biosynthesis glycosyltransferase